MVLKSEYDGIIIGAGHNALILAGYMARAGCEVVVLERYLEQGGGLDTHVDPRQAGFLHNMHSVFHRNLTNLPWWRDLQVGDFDVEYIAPEVGCGLLYDSDSCLLLYSDIEKTKKSIAKISGRDAETWESIYHRWQPVVREITEPMAYSPPIPWEQLKASLKGSKSGDEFLWFAERSPDEVVRDLFESGPLQGFLLFLADLRGYDSYSKRLGWIVPHMIATGVNPQLARGTSHRLAHALDASALSVGADVVEGREVSEILVEDGCAQGVKLKSGQCIYARRFIATSTGPAQTFKGLVNARHIDAAFAEKTSSFQYGPIGPIFSIHLALDERPVYKAERNEPDAGRIFLTLIGMESPDDMKEFHEAHEEGRIPRKLFFNGTTPSVFDPSQAPPGKHTAFMWQMVPYDLMDGGPQHWSAFKEEFLEVLFDQWAEYAPNLKRQGVVLNKFCQTPLDIEAHIATMVKGDQLVGRLTDSQYYDRRPLPELSRYRTPVKNLYLCGGCCHPGGNITGGPGYNSARVIAEDLNLKLWWNPFKWEEHLDSLK